MIEKPFETVPHVHAPEHMSEKTFEDMCTNMQRTCDLALARIRAVLTAGTDMRDVTSIRTGDHDTRIMLTHVRDEYERLRTDISRRGKTLGQAVRSALGLPSTPVDGVERARQVKSWEELLRNLLKYEHTLLSALYEKSEEFDVVRHVVSRHLADLELLLAPRSE